MSASATTNVVERAFQLARTGPCHSIPNIRQQLNAEGYEGVHGHLNGSTIQRQLREALAARGVSLDGDDDDDA